MEWSEEGNLDPPPPTLYLGITVIIILLFIYIFIFIYLVLVYVVLSPSDFFFMLKVCLFYFICCFFHVSVSEYFLSAIFLALIFFFSNCVKNLVKNFLYNFFFMRIELTFILFYTCWNVLITGVYFAGVEWRCDGKVCTDVSLPVYSTCVTLMSHAGILVFVDFFFLCVSFCKLQEVRLKKKSEQIWDVSFAFVSLSLFLSLIDSTFFYFFLFWYHLSSSSSSFFSLWFIFFSRNLFASVFIFVFSFFNHLHHLFISLLFFSFIHFFFLISLFVVWIFYVILFYFIFFLILFVFIS